MDWFEQLRREHEFGIGTIAGVAAKFGVHRRVVRRAIAGALPPPHHYTERSKPKLGALEAFIERVLDEDRQAPRKQRHTARRLYRRILAEFPDATVAESTVRNHVRERRRQLGLLRRETFVPQSYGWAQEAQVDWYEAWVDLGDERTRVQVFAMRSMASGAAFHRAYLHATQHAFLEAHEHAFEYFGGCSTCCAMTILLVRSARSCVANRREEMVRFMAFRVHGSDIGRAKHRHWKALVTFASVATLALAAESLGGTLLSARRSVARRSRAPRRARNGTAASAAQERS